MRATFGLTPQAYDDLNRSLTKDKNDGNAGVGQIEFMDAVKRRDKAISRGGLGG